MSYYTSRWREGKTVGNLPELEEFAQEVALAFLDRFYYNDNFEDNYIRILCEMSTAGAEGLQKIGASALFGIVVESLCDDFEDMQSEAYNRVMCHILTFCRELDEGSRLDRRMSRFGMSSFGDLFRRVERVRKTSCNFRDLPPDVKKILFLSRVTIGADVAVTSVLIQRFARMYPGAELVLLGGGKAWSLFRGNPRVKPSAVNYVRHGGLMQRLGAWLDVLATIEKELGELNPSEVLLVDSDSRLSQLGVLPLVSDRNYLFFNSRGSVAFPHGMSISEMANHWFNQVSASSDFCYPAVWLPRSLTSTAAAIRQGFRDAGLAKLTVINFGVGGNTRKRVGDAFEEELVLELLREPGTGILLDKGFGEREQQHALRILARAAKEGYSIADRGFKELANGDLPDARIIAVAAGIDEVAALIGYCDEFIGYDSACQHIAAASEAPAYTLFAGSNNKRFVRRWRPFGLGRNEIIHIDTLTHPPIYNQQAIIQRLVHLRRDE